MILGLAYRETLEQPERRAIQALREILAPEPWEPPASRGLRAILALRATPVLLELSALPE